ncbi:MAG: T9SS type A sorting domain-containing protein [Moheibacter sp.]
MKTIFTLLINCIFLTIFAQSTEIFDNSWYLNQIRINGVSYDKPNHHDSFSDTAVSSAMMFSSICESGGLMAVVAVDTVNQEINFTNISFFDGDCNPGESTQFKDKFFLFFDDIQTPVSYSVNTDSNGVKTLTFSNNGNVLTFFNQLNLPPETVLSNTWHLTDLIIDGVSNPPPSNEEVPYIDLDFTENDNMIYTTVCGSLNGQADFFTENQFFILNMEATAESCGYGNNPAYESLYLGFFWNNYYQDFGYLVEDIGNDNFQLTLIDQSGNQAIYNSQFLSVGDTESLMISVYPNPVKDKLRIENPGLQFNFIKVINSSGKLVIRQKMLNSSDEIDFTGLPQGLYVVNFEQNGKVLKTEKVLKK